MVHDHVRYLILDTPPQWSARALAIIAVLADTVTTLAVLYAGPRPAREVNPFGALLLTRGHLGEVLFMAIPLFTVLLLLYLPGILGDAVAVTNIAIHSFAAAVNLLHATGTPFAAVTGIPLPVAYRTAIIAATGIGIGVQLPRLQRRETAYQAA